MEFPCGSRSSLELFVLYKRPLQGDKIHFVLSLRVRPLPLCVSKAQKHFLYCKIPISPPPPQFQALNMAMSEDVHKSLELDLDRKLGIDSGE